MRCSTRNYSRTNQCNKESSKVGCKRDESSQFVVKLCIMLMLMH